MKRNFLVAIVLLLIGPNAFAAVKLETLRGFIREGKELVFEVTSYGCTRKSDFKLEVIIRNRIEQGLALSRLREDSCDGPAHGKILRYHMSELNLWPGHYTFGLENPVEVEPLTVAIP